jgi:methionyl-tRNA synthetase
MWADGAKMKASLSNTTKAAMDILEQIQLSKDWEFAKNPQNKGVLDQLLTDLKSKLSDFHRSFLIEEASQIKKQYGEDFLIKELEVLVSLKPDVAKVQDFVDKLRKRKNA